VLTGAGTRSCGQIIADLEKDEFLTSMYQSWIAGFLGGLNAGPRLGDDVGIDVSDYEGHWLWIRNYCAENPLNQVWEAAWLLFRELAVRQGKQL